MRRWRIGKVLPVVLAAWLLLMLSLSLDENSSQKTGLAAEWLHDVIAEHFEGFGISGSSGSQLIDFMIRKTGHFVEYMILAILLAGAGSAYNISLRKSAPYILLICLLAANIDEFIQGLTLNRNSRISDSLIDFSGSLAGLLLYYIVRKFIKK